MILEMLAPVVLLIGGVVALSKMGGAEILGQKTEQPQFPPELRSQFLTTSTHDGATIQSFQPAMGSAVLALLTKYTLVEQVVENAAPGRLLFKLVEGAGECTAQQAALRAQAEGFLVLGSLCLALEDTTAERFLAFVEPSDRKLATTDLAILLDELQGRAASPAASSRPTATPAAIDATMPAEVAREVEAALADTAAPVDMLRAMAADLEGAALPIGAAALRARADALDLQRKLASRRRPNAEPAPIEAKPVEAPPLAPVEQTPIAEPIAVDEPDELTPEQREAITGIASATSSADVAYKSDMPEGDAAIEVAAEVVDTPPAPELVAAANAEIVIVDAPAAELVDVPAVEPSNVLPMRSAPIIIEPSEPPPNTPELAQPNPAASSTRTMRRRSAL
jgi:hypothetical protein